MEDINCPLCDTAATYQRLMASHRRVIEKDGTYHYFDDPLVKLVLCRGCGLVFETPQYPDEYYRQFYADSYFVNPAAYASDEQVRSTTRLPIIKGLFRGQAVRSVLEVASASGANLHNVAIALCAPRIVGVEPVSEFAEYSRRMYHNTTIVQSRLEDFVTDERFDLVMAGCCVGHFSNPLVSFARIRNLLNPGGFLYIDDLASPLNVAADTRNTRWHKVFSHEKRFYYTAETLAAVLSRVGFTEICTGHLHWAHSYPAFTVTARAPLPGEKLIPVGIPGPKHADEVLRVVRQARVRTFARSTRDRLGAPFVLMHRIATKAMRVVAKRAQ